jgi:hypothetical protein
LKGLVVVEGVVGVIDKKQLGMGLIISAVAIALVSFIFIDTYDERKGLLWNVMNAHYTISKYCKVPGKTDSTPWWEPPGTPRCDYILLPFRWILALSSGLFVAGLFVKISRPR